MKLFALFVLMLGVYELEAFHFEENSLMDSATEFDEKDALIERDFDAVAKREVDLAKRDSDVISKRGAFQFDLMMRNVLKRDPFDYDGYGCWCGMGGKGKPVDGTDRCCKVHDECYSRLLGRKKKCGKGKRIYLVNYFFKGTKCYKGPGSTRCGRAACSCDSQAVKCFKRNKFNRKYKNWKQKKCRATMPPGC